MRAAWIEEAGTPDKLILGDVPEPAAGPGELRLEVRAAGIGPWDLKKMAGRMGNLRLPFRIGYEFAGVVDQVGQGVTDFAVGDEIYGTDRRAGSFAEYRICAPSDTARKPAGMTFEEAVALPVAGTTSLEGLVERLGLTKGETVVITAASGGVGTIAVQLAHSLGARVVAVASAANHDYVRALGADDVVDYHHDDWPTRVRVAVPGGADTLFDCAGGRTLERAFDAVRDGGRAVGIVWGGPDAGPRGISFERFAAASGTARLEAIARMADEDKLRVELAAELPLDQAREALERVAGGHTRGKVVLKLY